MSEYVFDFDKYEEPDIATGLREPIVRCHDCKFVDIWPENGPHWCARKDRGKRFNFEYHPRAFCSYGEPRDPCQITDENAAAYSDAPTMESAREAAQTPTLALGA